MPRILVVEDDTAQRFLFVQLLRRSGYDAIGVADADAAFAALGSSVHFDAVLTDMSMPGLHGAALLNAIKELYPTTPLVIMSVRSASDWELDPQNEAKHFLQKPFNRDMLTDTLRKALGLRGEHVT